MPLLCAAVKGLSGRRRHTDSLRGGLRRTQRRTSVMRPVLCEAVWLLDVRDAGSPPAIGSLVPAIAAALDACEASAVMRHVGITSDDVPALEIAIDTDRLTLVLDLIDNAVKHGHPGGGVFVGFHVADQHFVRVTIDDDGPGIAIADRDRIFALGERAVTAADGSGIGLALVRLMLERAGGRVHVEESPLGGARFVVDRLNHRHHAIRRTGIGEIFDEHRTECPDCEGFLRSNRRRYATSAGVV
jgi:signal transduction histidine kinase